ncbi:hypothetical protein [Natrarchaeobius oligotrophus]|uniref:hypothetical protein n=1 Tax=Natrarchaeobius oligotrophus TaxID=3455743 RepID=UPI0014050C9B|nr:hypothetical protein [Natrarchaeobius chitinivorans]
MGRRLNGEPAATNAPPENAIVSKMLPGVVMRFEDAARGLVSTCWSFAGDDVID